jgi:hypothetical protein
MTGGKPIAICSQSILGVTTFNPLVAFYDIHEKKGGGGIFFVLSRTPHETLYYIINYKYIFFGFIYRVNI